MADDFYLRGARKRREELDLQYQAQTTALAQAKFDGDEYAAGTAIQAMADILGECERLGRLEEQYVRSQNPPAPAPVSAEQRAARQWHEMDGQDVVDMVRTSKYAKNVDWNDP